MNGPMKNIAKSKELNLDKSVYELVEEYPEIKDIMAEIGFSEITKPAMLNSMGRIMTIPKGSKMKNIPMEKILAAFQQNGFTVIGDGAAASDKTKEEAEVSSGSASEQVTDDANKTEAPLGEAERNALLKGYLARLSAGEDLESVRADFVANFADVDPAKIMKAEQELMAEGAPLEEVQKLCDVHSALFHGATREEKKANAEKAVNDSMRTHYDQKLAKTEEEYKAALEKQQKLHESIPKEKYENKANAFAELADIYGHPINTYVRENEALAKLIESTREKMGRGEDVGAELKEMRQLSIHYASKGDLIYPVLDAKYDITGPSNVMWTVDDEIRDEMGSLEKESNHGAAWNERFEAVMKRAEEMIYKEENILFPICATNFTEEEWKGIYKDSMDYDTCFGVDKAVWEEAEADKAAGRGAYASTAAGAENSASKGGADGKVVLPGGTMDFHQLRALLNTIPGEITFVDENDINTFFNEGPKMFKRPEMALGREVWTCHPPKIEPMVRGIIGEFKSGERDEVSVWMDKGGHTHLVRYIAVRDTEDNYVGTLEFVQDMEFAKEHFAAE